MKRRLLIAVIAALLPWLCADAKWTLSPTKYDWTNLAQSITAGKTTNYDKFYAIYRWLCDNIAYDTTYKIVSADACYEAKRGVCAGYAELFCRIAEGAGLKADYIYGISRDSDGYIDPAGHAWVFAYLDPVTEQGILIDPTWGAGSVENGKFTRYKKNDAWFDPDPSLMVFSHLPEDKAYQLLDKPITRAQFNTLKYVDPAITKAGFDGPKVLSMALQGQSDNIPKIYPTSMSNFGVASATLPQTRHLRVGVPQKVVLKVGSKPVKVKAMGSGMGSGNSGEWRQQGSTIVGTFVPACEGEVNIGVNDGTGNYYNYIASYVVDRPTAAEVSKLEGQNPEMSPEWKRFSNFRPEYMKSLGMDLSKTLAGIKSGRVTSLPEYYNGNKVRLVDVPLNGVLRVGQTYRFSFVPQQAGKWAILNGTSGNFDWYYDIAKSANGVCTMTVTPKKTGELKLSLQRDGKGDYHGTVVYKVTR